MGERNFIPKEESEATNLNVSHLSSEALGVLAKAHNSNLDKRKKLPGVKGEDAPSNNLNKPTNLNKPEEIDWGNDPDKLAA